MSHESDSVPGPENRKSLSGRIDKAVGNTFGTAREVYNDASQKGTELLRNGQTLALGKLDEIQNKFGENYPEIFASNPLVVDSLSRVPLLIHNEELLSTVLNTSWATAALWGAATGSIAAFQSTAGHALGGMFHYGPGHVGRWSEVNQYMDSVAGSGHRLKYGHSVDFLPEIVERFGMEGVPAFFCHLLQDFTSVDGLPIIPNAWNIKQNLAAAGLAPKTATALVSLSASNVLAGMLIATTVWKIWREWDENKRKRTLLSTAEEAAKSRDYPAAIESYKRALEIERTPPTLLAIGQVYLERTSTRPHAHQAFADAVQLLGSDPGKTFRYYGAQISLRGIAGLQALATADVIGDRYPEYWQEKVTDLVNATIHSFVTSAAKLQRDAGRRITNPLVRPPLFSGAINRYLAAQAACQYPLLEDRQRIVTTHVTGAIGLIGQVAQQDEARLRDLATHLRGIWARTVLPEVEADLILASA